MALRCCTSCTTSSSSVDAGPMTGPDTAWRMLHDPAFRYGQGGGLCLRWALCEPWPSPAGFVSAYAQFAGGRQGRDLAWMLTPGYEARVQAWAQEDPSAGGQGVLMNAWLARPPTADFPGAEGPDDNRRSGALALPGILLMPGPGLRRPGRPQGPTGISRLRPLNPALASQDSRMMAAGTQPAARSPCRNICPVPPT